jgi:hypothetical protein
MSDEKPRKDLVVLNGPWAKHSARFKAQIAATGGEIRTYDEGILKLINGDWEVLVSGDLFEADVIRNALRRPS